MAKKPSPKKGLEQINNKKFSMNQPVVVTPNAAMVARESTISAPQTIDTVMMSQERSPKQQSGMRSPKLNGIPTSGSIHSGPTKKQSHPRMPSLKSHA